MLLGDALALHGDNPQLGRLDQLNALTRMLYQMTHTAPNQMSQIWSRRLLYFQRQLDKHMRDLALGRGYTPTTNNDADTNTNGIITGNSISAVPSMGQIVLLRCMGHVYPMSDYHHAAVGTPLQILLGQYVAQAPVTSLDGLRAMLIVVGMMVQHAHTDTGAVRLVPEAVLFVRGVLQLFHPSGDGHHDVDVDVDVDVEAVVVETCMPTLHLPNLRCPNIVKENREIVVMIWDMALRLVDRMVRCIEECNVSADGDANGVGMDVVQSLYQHLQPAAHELHCDLMIVHDKDKDTSKLLQKRMKRLLKLHRHRPAERRTAATPHNLMLKTFAPNVGDDDGKAANKSTGKKQQQAQLARLRRDYKREHKAVQRELRMDGALVEEERRAQKQRRDDKARDKRHKNFAWMESEQATMNQQVKQGGGLLTGGGIGAARAKAQSGKIGIKKGGRLFRGER